MEQIDDLKHSLLRNQEEEEEEEEEEEGIKFVVLNYSFRMISLSESIWFSNDDNI